eukprot:scaffold25834_cov68-Phaeocystis_antarctica.AAC.2
MTTRVNSSPACASSYTSEAHPLGNAQTSLASRAGLGGWRTSRRSGLHRFLLAQRGRARTTYAAWANGSAGWTPSRRRHVHVHGHVHVMCAVYRVVTGCEDARARDGPGAGPVGPLAAREVPCRHGYRDAHVRAIQPDIKDGVSR